MLHVALQRAETVFWFFEHCNVIAGVELAQFHISFPEETGEDNDGLLHPSIYLGQTVGKAKVHNSLILRDFLIRIVPHCHEANVLVRD